MKDMTAGIGSIGTAAGAGDQDDSIDIGRLLVQLWAGKFLIILCAVLGISAGVLIFTDTPKTFQADALLQLESKGGQIGLPTELLGLTGDTPESTTAIEIVRSRLVLGQARAALNLDWRAAPVLLPVIGVAVQRYDLPLPDLEMLRPYARRLETIELNLLQVEPGWVGKPIMLTVTGEGAYEVTLPNGAVLPGRVGETLQNPEKTFGLRLEVLTGAMGRQFVIQQRGELGTIAGLRNNLTVAEKGKGSGILLLSYRAANKRDAQRALNAIAEAYLQQNISRGTADADSGLQFLDSQLPIAEKAFRDAEEALTAYRRQAQVVDLTFESQAMLTQAERINTELQELQRQEDEIKQRYTPNHPVYQQLLNNRARLEAQLADLTTESDSLPEIQRNIVNMTRDMELAQQNLIQLQSRAQEVEVMRASKIGSVRIIDRAQAADLPIAPRASLILALGMLLGGMVGVALVFVRAWLRRGVQSAGQLEQLGLPVFATVNYVASSDMKRSRRSDSWPLVAITDPGNIAVEAFRSLRTSLHFGMLDAPTNALVIISPAPGAGKSFTAANLAVVMAQGGQRVCLIDADLRRGQLRKFFGKPKNTPGLAEYLGEEKTLDEVLLDGPVAGLSFISSGRYPPNPTDLLLRSRMHELLALLAPRFDMVILDAPPVLAVTDPVVLGRIAGAILLVARFDSTQIAEIEATRRTLETAGLKITGAVLNGYDPRKAGTSRYGYSYRYDYKQRAD